MKRSSVIGTVRGKKIRLDPCLRGKIEALNRHAWVTVGSCCGHGEYPETILVRGITGIVRDLESRVIIPRTRRFYQRDPNGLYFVKEVIPILLAVS